MDAADYSLRAGRLQRRLETWAEHPWGHHQADRLARRLGRHRTALLTFLSHPEAPSDNNHAERSLRPAVQRRKTCYCNQSDRGAQVQTRLMTIFGTLRLREVNPLDAILAAREAEARTCELPPLPSPDATSDG